MSIHLFFRRLAIGNRLSRKNKQQLRLMLKSPEEEIEDIIWWNYLKQISHINELREVALDNRLPCSTRMVAWRLMNIIVSPNFGFSDMATLAHSLPKLIGEARYEVQHYDTVSRLN